jgi:hypothetical protein
LDSLREGLDKGPRIGTCSFDERATYAIWLLDYCHQQVFGQELRVVPPYSEL